MSQLKILLASQSVIKKDALEKYFSKYHPQVKYVLNCVNCDGCQLPPQPIFCGEYCTYQRIKYALGQVSDEYDIVVAIENDLVAIDKCMDRANVRVEAHGIVGTGVSFQIECPIDPKFITSQDPIEFSGQIIGVKKTGGEILHETEGLDPKNWMLKTAGIDRSDQILDAVYNAFTDLFDNISKCYQVYSSYTVHANFPKEGVNFKYFYSLFSGKTNNMNSLAKIFESKYLPYEFDAVLPLESRGLIIGTLLADHLEIPMIPLQKPGKIPGKTMSISYEKEYGHDEIQISLDLVETLLAEKKKTYRFLLVDDLIATAGTLEAGIKILKMLSEKYNFQFVCHILVLDEIKPLRSTAESKLKNSYDVTFRDINNTYQKFSTIFRFV